MKTIIKHIAIILLTLVCSTTVARNQRDTLQVGWRAAFSENLGQWEPQVRYRSVMGGATLFLEEDRFTLLLQHPDNPNLHHHPGHKGDNRYRSHAYQVVFLGATTDTLTGAAMTPDYENYYLGNDRSRWRGHVRQYREIRYQGLYPGIDLTVYSASNALKYDFVVAPHADPSQIHMRYDGTEGIRLKDGNIVVQTSVADIVELRPYVYQMVEGREVAVEASYVVEGNEVRFALGDYDTTKELVIDPYLYFSTYTGSTADNWGTTAAYDQMKNVYTSGVVFGIGYPTSLGAYDGTFNGNADVGIFVFSPLGDQRIYTTYLGGTRADMPHSMFVNDLNELVIYGTTGSANFPVTPQAYDTTFNGGTPLEYESAAINYPNGSDIFVCRFSPDGATLQASTYVGGSGNDGLNYENYYNSSYDLSMLGNDSIYANYGDGARGELIADNLDNIYVGSTTKSDDFPVTPGNFGTPYGGGQDGIVFKLDYNLQHLLWAGYLGGSKDDAVYSIDVDDEYNLLVCGGTCSTDLPTTDGSIYQHYQGGSADGFVAKISYHGNNLMACTYMGSSAYDQCYFVRCGKKNDVFLFGQTKAWGSTMIRNATYGVPNAGQFLSRLAPDLDSIKWSTTFGSGRNQPDISPTAFAADICDRVYAVGWGRYFCNYPLAGSPQWFGNQGTTNMPVTPDAYQSTTDAQDFYIFAMDDAATQQIYGSYFGELHSGSGFYGGHDHVDGGTSRFDRCATLYQSVCSSCGGTSGFPTTPTAWSQTNDADNCNNAVFRFNVSDDFPVADFPQQASVCANDTTPLLIPFTGRADSVRWDYGDGTSDNGQPSTLAGRHHYSHPGIYTIQLVAYMDTGCHTTDTLARRILVLGDTTYYLDTLRTCGTAPVQLGMAPLPFTQYRWIQGLVTDSTVANPYTSVPGHYIMVVARDSGCTDTVHQVVVFGQSTLHIEGDTLSCSSPLTYTADIAGRGATFVWSFSNTFADTIGNNRSIELELNGPTTLYCHAIDGIGCESVGQIHINFYRIMDTLLVEPSPCPGSCEGSVTVVNSGLAVKPFSYQFDGQPSSDSTHSNLCAGTHTALFSDANGCSVSKQFSILEPAEPSITATLNHIRCVGDHSGSIGLNVRGMRQPYSVVWDNGSTSMTRQGLAPGTYGVTLTDSAGCQYSRSYTIEDAVDHFANIQVWADDSVVFINESTHLHAEGCDECTYLWQPADGLDNALLASPVATLTDTTLYVVTLTDSAGCEYSDSVRVCCIRLDCGTTALYIPNAFTPNGDGLNDQLCFRNEWVVEFEFHLFSRWGEQVYESTDINACWDGTFHGRPCLPGVYTYYCKIVCEGHQEATFKGDITLLR